ncbi:hypothetical protein COCON_G00010450 [Conger conger]|uniref:Uncharacterized protein n=1 Tax=Conger conger TaxID=82655 RepID=A0A9Q1E2A9_CONCO|nr:hypothetical protein COCON_G00010450 [Conger conger]
MGCSSSSTQTIAQEANRPGTKPEESNGEGTFVGHQNGFIAEDCETIADQMQLPVQSPLPDDLPPGPIEREEPVVTQALDVAVEAQEAQESHESQELQAVTESEPLVESILPEASADTPETATEPESAPVAEEAAPAPESAPAVVEEVPAVTEPASDAPEPAVVPEEAPAPESAAVVTEVAAAPEPVPAAEETPASRRLRPLNPALRSLQRRRWQHPPHRWRYPRSLRRLSPQTPPPLQWSCPPVPLNLCLRPRALPLRPKRKA